MDFSEFHPGERVSWLKAVINISLRSRLLEKKWGVRVAHARVPRAPRSFLRPVLPSAGYIIIYYYKTGQVFL